METDPIKEKPKKSTRSGRQTLFRVTFRNQITLIRIADTKANMILGINTGILGLLMAVVGTKTIFTDLEAIENYRFIVPVACMMLTAMISAIYAVRSTKPRLIKPVPDNDQPMKGRKSYLFFENIYNMSLEDYIDKMEQIIESSKDVHINMIIDIYNQSKVLHMKYKLLRLSYVIFINGLVISIVMFLIFWLFLSKPSI
jgi:hypothetical protein